VTLQEEERSLTDAKLEMLFPSVPWRDPIRISDVDGNFGFACRFCIARHGISGCDIPSLSMSEREVRRHIGEHHPWSVGHGEIRRKRLRRTSQSSSLHSPDGREAEARSLLPDYAESGD